MTDMNRQDAPRDESRGEARDAKRKLPDGWRWVRLEEVTDPHNGHWGKEAPFPGSTEALVVGVGNIANNGLITLEGAQLRHLSPSEKEAIAAEGDLLVVKSSGSATNIRSGKTGLCPSELAGEIACSNFMIRLAVRKELADPYLLWIILNSNHAKTFIRRIAGSTTYPNIKWSAYRSFSFPLPPLPEQKRIAAILNEQMAAVERARAGAESRLEAARALPAAYLRAVFSSAQAQQWPRRRLGEICEILAGFAWPSGGFSDRGLPVIRIQNLGDNDRARFAYWSGSYEEDYVVQNGDLLISLSGTVPVSFKAEIWSRGPALLNQRIVRLRAKGDGVSLEWLARNVTFQLENIFGKAAGSTGIANAKMGVVTALDVPVPTLADQQRVVAILRQQMAEAERVLKVVEEELAAISALPAALLRRAFSGAL